MVLYMPNPKIIAEKRANGIRIKILVFRPIVTIHLVPINLSQFYSKIIVKVP